MEDRHAMPLAGLKVLIAEDEAFVAVELENVVREAGGLVVASESTCEKTLEYAKSGARIDVALLDVNLSDREVFDAAHFLVETSVPIVFYSGRMSREALASLFPKSGWLRKPSSDEDIVEMLSCFAAS